MKTNAQSTRLFSSKNQQTRIEDGKSFKIPIHSRQKSASQQKILSNHDKFEAFGHCDRMKIRELILYEIQNECEINCRNIEKVKFLEKQIKDLLESNVYLKKINEYLIKSLTRKEELFLNVTNENKNLKVDNQLLNSHIGSKNAFNRERVCSRENLKKGNNFGFFNKINNNNNNGNNNLVIDGNIQNGENLNNYFSNGNGISNNFEIEEVLRKIKSEELEFNFLSSNNSYNNNYNNFNNDLNLKNEKEFTYGILGKNKNRYNMVSEINYTSEVNNDNAYLTKNKSNEILKDFNKVKYIIDAGNKNEYTHNKSIKDKNTVNNNNKECDIDKLHNILNSVKEESYPNLNKAANSSKNPETYTNLNANLSPNINSRTIEFKLLNDKLKIISKIKKNEKQETILDETFSNNNIKSVNKLNFNLNLIKINPNNIKDNKNKQENTFLHKFNNGSLSARNDSELLNQINSPLSFAAGNPLKSLIFQTQNQKQKNYYEKISGIMRKARIENNNKTKEENLISFLSLEKNSIEKLFGNRMFRKIKKLIQSENEFFEKLKSYDEEKLSGYFEVIASVSDNLQNAVNLISKVKFAFEKILFSQKLETKENLYSSFINLITEIFECEKVLIYKFDEFSDNLIICAGKAEDPLNDLRICKSFGIIGQVLKNGEAMRIDDAALDPLFIKDKSSNSDHLKNIKIRNLMCAPVKVHFGNKEDLNDNKSIINHIGNNFANGVSVNNTALKGNSNLFNTINSENASKAFDTIKSNGSNEAKKTVTLSTYKNKNTDKDKDKNNIIINAKKIESNLNKINNKPNNNSNLNDSNINTNFKTIAVLQILNKTKGKFTSDESELLNLISGLFSLCAQHISQSEFESQQISKLKTFCEFSSEKKLIKNKSEITVLFETLLISMFSGNCAQLLFFDSEKDELRRITKYENKLKPKGTGIIGFVLEKNEFYGCESIINCQHFCGVIDLETTCNLLTYPIDINNKLIAVLQFGYQGKLLEGKRPHAADEAIVYSVIKSIVSWVCFVSENDIVEKENN